MPSGPVGSTPGGGEGAPVAPVCGRGPSTVSRRYTGTATSTLHGGSVTGRQKLHKVRSFVFVVFVFCRLFFKHLMRQSKVQPRMPSSLGLRGASSLLLVGSWGGGRALRVQAAAAGRSQGAAPRVSFPVCGTDLTLRAMHRGMWAGTF